VFVWTNFTRAFPEASLDFKVNRTTSRPAAEEFLRLHAPQAAPRLEGARRAAVFELDDDAKVFLERELGLEELGGLIARREVRLWSWSHRWFRALDKEEVRVAVSPEGEVIGFTHLLPEEDPGASLDEDPARSIAERLLAAGFGLDAAALRFIESKREDRPARRDWTFTWERDGWRQAEATYRFQVVLHGDQPGAYREFLKVPDAWTQSYQRLRAHNNTTAQIAGFGLLLTGLAAVIVMFIQARRGNVRWRVAVLLALVSFALFFLLDLNNLPLALYGFDTTGSFGSFLAGQVLFALAGAGLQALPILILVAAGEALYRTRFPQHLRVGAVLVPPGWRGKRFAFGLALGYALAVLFIAYQVAFYLVGKRFGAWNPADVPFSNLLNTAFPWLAVLFIGFYPAVSEEFLSRLFSIPLVEGLTKSRVAAVVIPALLWGFAHANYPAQPFFIRGVEVSIAGLAAGILLYRFGVVPCLVWHYVVDAGYTSLLLVRSGNPYFVATAIVGTGVLLVPLVVALVGAWRRGGFVDEQASLNAGDPPPPVPEAAPVEATAAPLSALPVRRAAAIAVPLLVVGALLALRAPDLSRDVAVELRPASARAAAEAFLRERGEDPAGWRFVVTANADPLGATARRYLLEQGGLEAVRRRIVEVPPWQVRAFRPEDREEWQFGVDDPSARVVRFEHVLREETPGAALPVAEARALAERHLAGIGLDPAALEFKEGRSEQRPARLDHEFTWKDPARSVGEAEYLVTVSVQGDRVDAEQRRLKLPEAWERARERQTVLRYGLLAVKIGMIALLVVHGLLAFYRGVRGGGLPWRRIGLAAGLLGVLAVLPVALELPLAWAQYPTSMPEALFRVSLLLGVGVTVVLLVAMIFLALGVLAACFPRAVAVTVREARRPAAASAIWVALAALGAWTTVTGLVALARGAVPSLFPDVPVSLPTDVATAVPALAGLGGAVTMALFLLALAALAAHLWQDVPGGALRALLAAGFVVALIPSGADSTWPELATGVVVAALFVAVAALLVRHLLGDAALGWVATAALLALVWQAMPLLRQGGGFYEVSGALVLLVGALAGGWWLLARRS